jgi:hypothetical protein
MPKRSVKKGQQRGASDAARKPVLNRIAEIYSERYPVLPLDYMLSMLNRIHPATGKPFTRGSRPSAKRLDRIAIAAANLVHRRLSPISVADSQPAPTLYFDYRGLTDEELDQLVRLNEKVRVSDRPIDDPRVATKANQASGVGSDGNAEPAQTESKA